MVTVTDSYDFCAERLLTALFNLLTPPHFTAKVRLLGKVQSASYTHASPKSNACPIQFHTTP